MFSIFQIKGGLGKHVAATAMCKAIKKNYPDRKLIVVCAYPEIFLTLECVDRVLQLGQTPYFYQDYVEGQDSEFFLYEPYLNSNHINKKVKLLQNWIEMYGMDYDNELPELRFNMRHEQYYSKKWGRQRPVLLLNTNGGPLNGQVFNYSWTRDIPEDLSKALVDYYKQEGYHIMQVCRNKSQGIVGVDEIISDQLDNMELFYLLKLSTKRILIDSSLQHAAVALNLPSTVVWVGTSPDIFGYDLHKNVVAELPNHPKLINSYLFDYEFSGITHECPIMPGDILFNIQDIID